LIVCWDTPERLGEIDLGDALRVAQGGDAGAELHEEGAFIRGDGQDLKGGVAEDAHSLRPV
jgi:hypothetical protein